MRLLILILFLSPSIAYADFKINLQNVPLSSAVEVFSSSTGQAFVYSSEFKETPITLLIPEKKPLKDMLLFLDDSLRSSGLMLSNNGRSLTIEPINSLAKTKTRFYSLPLGYKTKDFISSINNLIPSDSNIDFSVFGLDSSRFIVTSTDEAHKRIKSILTSLNKDKFSQVYDLYSSLSDLEIKHIKESYPDAIITFSNHRLAVTGTEDEHLKIYSFLSSFTQKITPYQVNFVISSISTQDSKDRSLNFILNAGSFSLSDFALSLSSTKTSNSFNVFLNWLDSFSSSSVLSKPHLQLQPDGELSRFNLGEEISVQTSSVDSPTGQSIQNYERKNLGLTIEASLDFSYGGKMNLKLNQSISSVSGYDAQKNPIFDSQQITSNLTVEPDRVYVVGGVKDIRTTSHKSSFFIPLSRSNSKQSSNLFIFVYLTPLDPLNLSDISNKLNESKPAPESQESNSSQSYEIFTSDI